MTSKTEKWFITGASGGLGLALTRRVLKAGNTVVAAVRNPAALAGLQQQFAGQLIVEKLDVTDYASLPAIAQSTVIATSSLITPVGRLSGQWRSSPSRKSSISLP